MKNGDPNTLGRRSRQAVRGWRQTARLCLCAGDLSGKSITASPQC